MAKKHRNDPTDQVKLMVRVHRNAMAEFDAAIALENKADNAFGITFTRSDVLRRLIRRYTQEWSKPPPWVHKDHPGTVRDRPGHPASTAKPPRTKRRRKAGTAKPRRTKNRSK